MDNKFYFPHDSNARNDEKILELRANKGLEGYALYFMLLESMSEQEDGLLERDKMGGLSLGYGVAKDTLNGVVIACIELGLFYEEGNKFGSRRMLSHLSFRKGLKNAGKKGAEIRWSKKKNKIAQTKEKNRVAIRGANAKGKERKGKERKENIKQASSVAVDILEFFNKTCGTNLKLTSGKSKQIKTRLETFSLEEIKQAIVARTKIPWYAGKNDQCKIWYKDWDSLFRNDEKIDKILNSNNEKPILIKARFDDGTSTQITKQELESLKKAGKIIYTDNLDIIISK